MEIEKLIMKVKKCQVLEENEVKLLCDKVFYFSVSITSI